MAATRPSLRQILADLSEVYRRDGILPFVGKLLAHSVVRYLILTVLSLSLIVSLTSLLHEWLGLSLDSSYVVGLVAAFVLNFLGMRYYVYGGPSRPFFIQLGGFFVSSIGFRIAEALAFSLVHQWFGRFYAVAILAVQGASFVAKFLVYQFFLFGRRGEKK